MAAILKFFELFLEGIVRFFAERAEEADQNAAQRELERLRLENESLKKATEQARERQEIEDEVAKLSDDDLLKRL